MSHHSASEELHKVGPDNPGFDTSDPNTPGVTIFIVLFIVTLVLVIGATIVYYNFASQAQEDEAVLQKPSEDLANLHAREDEQLKTYGFINKEKGVVQIPLDRAMELVAREAAEGKPKYPTTPVAVKVEPAAGATAAPGTPAAPAPATTAPAKAPEVHK